MSHHAIRARLHQGRFPRVSGDEPDLVESIRNVNGFSPRERG